MNNKSIMPTLDLARKLIAEQFPEYARLPVGDVEKQGHDNRTYRLGDHMLIRMPTAEDYALKVPKEQELMPQLAKRLSVSIPAPIKMGKPSADYPYPFSIYKWLPGKSINLLTEIIDASQLFALWDNASATKWDKQPLWIHGDFAIGNILMDSGKLCAVIDFGGAAVGDPACDLVIAWAYLSGKARETFISEMDMDSDIWLRARAWALWKATFELCQIADKNSLEARLQKRIIDEVMNG